MDLIREPGVITRDCHCNRGIPDKKSFMIVKIYYCSNWMPSGQAIMQDTKAKVSR